MKWDFETLTETEGGTTHDESIGTKDMPTERRREQTRLLSEARGDGDSDMRNKTPDRPAFSPLSVVAANDQDVSDPIDIEGITAREGDEVPMTVDEHYPPAEGMGKQVSGQEQHTLVDAGGQAAAATDSQVAPSKDAATASGSNEAVGDSPLSPPVSDADQEPPQPKLVDEIIKAVASAERKQFKNGDVAIILDSADLCKALLVSSDRLKLASRILSVVSLDQKLDRKATSEVSQVFVLEPSDPTPLLRALGAGATLAEIDAQRVTSDVTPVSETLDKVKIKREEGSQRAEQSSESSAKWTTAYSTLFEVINASKLGATKRPVFGINANEAHAHIVAVMAIAKHYEALPALEMAFVRSMNTWIRNGSLYAAIKDSPVSWLDIGITMRNRDIFDEAFVHCAGALVGCPGALATLHPAVTAVMETKAAELTEIRKKVDPKLSNLTLTVEIEYSRGYHAMAFVSIKDDPVAWIVNQLFADWMREHLYFLNGFDGEEAEQGGEFEPETPVHVKTTATCDHKGKQCLNAGGFYRLLGKADDSYLSADKVLELLADWNKTFAHDSNKAQVRNAMQKLKTMAKAIVGSLADSNLTYTNVDELAYLTCVEVEEGDVPWEVDEDVKMEG